MSFIERAIELAVIRFAGEWPMDDVFSTMGFQATFREITGQTLSDIAARSFLEMRPNVVIFGSQPGCWRRISEEEMARTKTVHGLMNEVGLWHRMVFGSYEPRDHIRAIAQKVQEEGRELHENPCAEEIADVLICGLAAADRLNIDPVAAVLKKLAILYERGDAQLERDRARGIIQAKDLADGTVRLMEGEICCRCMGGPLYSYQEYFRCAECGREVSATRNELGEDHAERIDVRPTLAEMEAEG